MTWYAVSAILYYQVEGPASGDPLTVLENVYLFEAEDDEAARTRGEARAKADASASGDWQVEGKPATLRYGGIRKVVSCAPNPDRPGPSEVATIHDGVEATYSRYRVANVEDALSLGKGDSVTVAYEE